MMTVFVLAVLWLIVVVPMVLRRGDEKRRDGTVDRFGRAMRALGRRPVLTGADVFVAAAPRPVAEPDVERRPTSIPTRRPVPAPQEALMHPVDRSEMSEARAAMMRRRRRSLTVLGVGSFVSLILALAVGGALWVLAVPFLLGLGGYVLFLRSQALNDRERRAARRVRAAERPVPHDYEGTEDIARVEAAQDSVVRIDDDDLDLHSMDTIDLTGLYTEDLIASAAQRRAS